MNQQARSLDRLVKAQFLGEKVTISGIPGAPFSVYQIIIQPEKYRRKTLFLNIAAGAPRAINETLMIRARKGTPVFPNYAALASQPQWSALYDVLQRSQISAHAYASLTDLQKGGLFNLFAKMQAVKVSPGQTVFGYVERITKITGSRLYAIVDESLFSMVQDMEGLFRRANGTLHRFPEGWKRTGSFKTRERVGNLELTFAKDSKGGHLVDADIDDHQGLRHVWDVLVHMLTGGDTHPYFIHQILLTLQGIDPGFRLR